MSFLFAIVYWGLFGIITIPAHIVMALIGAASSGPQLSRERDDENQQNPDSYK